MLMGKNSAKGKSYRQGFKYGDLFLQTEKLVYTAGETVTGKVYLNLISAFPSNKLMLRFKAQQGINIVVATDQTKEKEVYVEKNLHSKNHAIIKDIIELHTWEESEIPVGQYIVPFSFLLDSNLASSFCQDGPYFHGHIIYKLEAYLESSVENGGLKLKYKQKLKITEIIKPDGMTNKEVNKQFKKSCFCINSGGSVVLKASLDKTCFHFGEIIKIDVIFDPSRSFVTCHQLSATVIQKTVLKTTDKTREAEVDAVEVKVPRVDVRRQPSKQTIKIKLPDASDIDQEARNPSKKYALLQIKSDKNEISQTTTMNANLTSTFRLEVCACLQNYEKNADRLVKIIFPINIVYAKADIVPQVKEPEKWEPKVLSTANIVFPFNRLNPNELNRFKTIKTPIPRGSKEISLIPLPRF